MALSDLTSRAAVEAAIAEFDRVGREAFLAQHSFGPARRYMLVANGRFYDSKAIAGVAHGYQFPEADPLTANAFSGGEATVRRVLRKIGFEVVRLDAVAGITTVSGYWIFVCNPKKWAIDRFLAERIERDTWGIRPADQKHMAPGQLALIRVGVDRRPKSKRLGPPLQPGIYALCEIESMAYPGHGSSGRFWASNMGRDEGWPTVDIRYLRVYADRPLGIARLKAELPNLSPLLLNSFQGSSFPIAAADFHAVLNLLGEDPQLLPGLSLQPPTNTAELADLLSRYLHAAPVVKERVSRVIERGPIGRSLKRLIGHRCQLCDALGHEPIGFRKANGDPYVEAHHVRPVAMREIGSLSAANVVIVCANHHRQLHYGGVNVAIGDDAFTFDLPERSVTVPRLRQE